MKIDEWNQFYPVGSPCWFTGEDAVERLCHTKSTAWAMSDGRTVIEVSVPIQAGRSRTRLCYLTELKMCETTVTQYECPL